MIKKNITLKYVPMHVTSVTGKIKCIVHFNQKCICHYWSVGMKVTLFCCIFTYYIHTYAIQKRRRFHKEFYSFLPEQKNIYLRHFISGTRDSTVCTQHNQHLAPYINITCRASGSTERGITLPNTIQDHSRLCECTSHIQNSHQYQLIHTYYLDKSFMQYNVNYLYVICAIF